jgi:predicted O-linked N-acetylglucosamine transferase (SPINDLY family)
MSGELRRHAVATFLEPWLIHHDRKSVRITCYPTLGKEDEVSARLKAAVEEWVPAGSMSDAGLAARIRADRPTS